MNIHPDGSSCRSERPSTSDGASGEETAETAAKMEELARACELAAEYGDELLHMNRLAEEAGYMAEHDDEPAEKKTLAEGIGPMAEPGEEASEKRR